MSLLNNLNFALRFLQKLRETGRPVGLIHFFKKRFAAAAALVAEAKRRLYFKVLSG